MTPEYEFGTDCGMQMARPRDTSTNIRFDSGQAAAGRQRISAARNSLGDRKRAALADIDRALVALDRLAPRPDIDALIEDLRDARRKIEEIDPSALPSGKALKEISDRLNSRLEAFRDLTLATTPTE